MTGYLLHIGAQLSCTNAGQATPNMTNNRVLVSGKATVLQSTIYSVAGCIMPPPNAGNGPCATASWLSGTTRVTSNNQPLLIDNSSSTCTPTGDRLQVVTVQNRVKAT